MRTRFVSIISIILAILCIAGSVSVAQRTRQPGIFPDSCVRSVTPWEVREQADYLPEDILPAYIGSGDIGIGLDASGMQNLDCRIAMGPRYTNVPFETKDELYVFSDGMVSNHYYPTNLMPLGYLGYELTIDGKAVSIRDAVTAWRRTISVRTATVETVLSLRQGVRLSVSAFTPQEMHLAYFQFGVQSTDGKAHAVVIRPQLSLLLRERNGGAPILDRVTGRSQAGDRASVTGEVRRDGKYSPLEDYNLSYAVKGSRAWANESALGAELVLHAGTRLSSGDVAFSIGADDAAGSFDGARRDHMTDWAHYYDSGATISIGDPVREFLFNNSTYLFRIGGTFNHGLPLEFLLFHPENWHASTFWDLSFIVDGLLKSNHLEQPKRVLRWLNASAEPTGRTFHWLTLPNGTDGMPKGQNDTNYVVNAAHAMSAIRYYETTHDREFLKSTLYPLLRNVSVYLAAERFTKEGDHFIGSGSGIDANSPVLVNDTFSTLWFAVVLRKTADYAKALGVDASERAAWTGIADHIQLDTCERGYKYCRTWSGPDGWVWMLLYPTEGMPFVNIKVFAKNREFPYYGDLGQPWCYFWQASSDYRTGLDLVDSSERYITEGVRFTYGPGYFAEAIPKEGVGHEGLPPYTSAHGSYLTASMEQLVYSSVWDDQIGVFTNLPSNMRDREVSFRNIRTSQGVVVSGDYSPTAIHITLSGEGKATVHIRVPEGLASGKVKVRVDGAGRAFERKGSMVTMRVELLRDEKTTIQLN